MNQWQFSPHFLSHSLYDSHETLRVGKYIIENSWFEIVLSVFSQSLCHVDLAVTLNYISWCFGLVLIVAAK